MDPHFEGVIFQTHTAELRRRLRRPFPPFRVLDVRAPEEVDRRRIPGALRVDPAGLQALPEGATEHTELFVVGSAPDDPRVREASLALMRLGAHRVVEMGGGMSEWERTGGPVESGRARAA
jgi:rhodanese-related sulfurtransferase